MKIIILNQHGLNYGDDAAIAAALGAISRWFPSASIDLVYNFPDFMTPSPISGLGKWVTHHLCTTVQKRDILIFAAGALAGRKVARFMLSTQARELLDLIESADLVFVSPCGANIGLYRDWVFLGRILAAIDAGARPIFHLNTIGQSNDWRFDTLANIALARSDVYVRERRSYDRLRSLGIGASLGADSAFGLPPLPSVAHTEEIVLIPTNVRKWFASFSQFDSSAFERELCAVLSESARRRGLAVRIVPHLYGELNERDYLESIAAGLVADGAPSVTIDAVYDDFRSYEKALAQARAVVSMRYHGIVLAAKNAVPFVSLSYENKMVEVSRYVGFEGQSIDLMRWDPSSLHTALDRCFEEEARIRAELEWRRAILADLSQLPTRHAWILQNS